MTRAKRASYGIPLRLLTSPFPRASPQGTPEALPYPILRRLSSTSHRRAMPSAAVLWAAPAGRPRRPGGAARAERAPLLLARGIGVECEDEIPNLSSPRPARARHAKARHHARDARGQPGCSPHHGYVMCPALDPPLGGFPLRKGGDLKMRSDGVLDGETAHVVAPKGGGMVVVKVRRGGVVARSWARRSAR